MGASYIGKWMHQNDLNKFSNKLQFHMNKKGMEKSKQRQREIEGCRSMESHRMVPH